MLAIDHSVALDVGARWLALGAVVLVFAARPRVLAVTTLVVLVVAVFVVPPAAIFQGRNFFGVVQVLRPRVGSRPTCATGPRPTAASGAIRPSATSRSTSSRAAVLPVTCSRR